MHRQQNEGLEGNADPRGIIKRVETMEEALTGADFVVISIMPGTLTEMESDVHARKNSLFTSPLGIPRDRGPYEGAAHDTDV